MGTWRGARADGGFTLVELMSVVAILGILVAVAVASSMVSMERSRTVACLSNQRSLDGAVVQYQIEHNAALPPDLAAVQAYVGWRGGDYATCTADSSVAFTYDPNTGVLGCPDHAR
jgi:prepilin-type N-terminal cleavage/methylation domain-containing protein